MRTCREESVVLLAAGELKGWSALASRAHLIRCKTCRQELLKHRATMRLLQSTFQGRSGRKAHSQVRSLGLGVAGTVLAIFCAYAAVCSFKDTLRQKQPALRTANYPLSAESHRALD